VNSNSIPSFQNPLEGIQSHTYTSWLSPFSWYKPDWFIGFLLALSHFSATSLPAADQDPEGRVKRSNNAPLTPRANLRQKTLLAFSFIASEFSLTMAAHHSKAPLAPAN